MAESIELRERTVTVGGYEYDDGPVHVVVMPRTFRIREYTAEQIELRMMLSFAAGFCVAALILLVPALIFRINLPI